MGATKLLGKLTFLCCLIISQLLATNSEDGNSKYIVKGNHQLDNVITELANKLFVYNKLSGDNEEIAITSFVDLDKLNKTTHFGRTLSEAFFDELFTRGFNVSDFRAQDTLSINANGEYFLTRDIRLLNKDVTSAYILVGTYSFFEGKVLINARILDNQSGKVLASARSNYLSSDCSLLENCKKPRIIRITTDGCSSEGCPKVSKRDIAIKQEVAHLIKRQRTIPNTLTKVDLNKKITNNANNYALSLIK